MARERARVSAEKRLSATPDDEPAAWVLADLLRDEMAELRDGNRSILVPSEMTSAGGATLTRLPDNSILVSGSNLDRDRLTLIARADLTRVTGVRLEAIPDPSLPVFGPGRERSFGAVHLSASSAAVAPGGDRLERQGGRLRGGGIDERPSRRPSRKADPRGRRRAGMS